MIKVPSIKLNITKGHNLVTNMKMELHFLLSAHLLNVLHIRTKFCENIFDDLKGIEQTQILC